MSTIAQVFFRFIPKNEKHRPLKESLMKEYLAPNIMKMEKPSDLINVLNMIQLEYEGMVNGFKKIGLECSFIELQV